MKQRYLGLDCETQPNWDLWKSDIYPEFESKPLEYKLGNLVDEDKIEAKKKTQKAAWEKEEAKRSAEYIDKKRKKFSIDPNLCQVVCVCLWGEDTDVRLVGPEAEMLRKLWDILLDSDTAIPIVTKNGVMFDIPVLLVRSQILGILTHIEVQRIHSFYLGKPWTREAHHIDLQEQPGGKASLEVLSRVWLNEEKIDISKRIVELVESGNMDGVLTGCSQHARLAHDIGKKMLLY